MTARAAATLCSCIGVSLAVSGCGRYADFTLPRQPQAGAAAMPRLQFDPKPVLTGELDVLNPSVVRFQGEYWNLYSAFDGTTWHTHAATSADGIRWTKRGRILSPEKATWEGSYIAANGSALAVGGQLWYWYQAADRIGLAKSGDGRTWRKEPGAVLRPGPYLSWDERAVADPYVIRLEGWFYLYYLGQNRSRQQQLGVARSRDGINWQKLRSNPIVELPQPGAVSPDENGLGEPAVWLRGGAYWMLYTGRDRRENRSLTLMRSGDGVRWKLASAGIRGSEPWNAKVLCDATVLDGRFWFGGGDVASPDERLHGQIGTGAIP